MPVHLGEVGVGGMPEVDPVIVELWTTHDLRTAYGERHRRRKTVVRSKIKVPGDSRSKPSAPQNHTRPSRRAAGESARVHFRLRRHTL